MNPDIQKLQQRVAELENTLKNLSSSSTIPRNIEDALTQRLNFLNAITTTAAGTPTSASSFPVSVPANPSGALEVSVGGIIYKLLYV